MTTGKGFDYTFILKVAILLGLVWVFVYRPAPAPEPELVVTRQALRDEVGGREHTPQPVAEAEVSPESIAAVIETVEETDHNRISPNTAAPVKPSTAEREPPKEMQATTQAEAFEVLQEETTTAEAALNLPKVERPSLITHPRDLLNIRDRELLAELEARAQKEQERLHKVYEENLKKAVSEEKRKLEVEAEKLSSLYEDEIRAVRRRAAERQEKLEQQIAALRAEAEQKEKALREQLNEIRKEAEAKAAHKQEAPADKLHKHSFNLTLNWKEGVCGVLDKPFLTKELEQHKSLLLSIEPVLPEFDFPPFHIDLQASRILAGSTTSLTFETNDTPLALGLFICSDQRDDGRCINKPALDVAKVRKNSDYHKEDKLYYFAFVLIAKEKFYLLAPSNDEAFYRKLERAMTLLNVPEKEAGAVAKRIRSIHEDLSGISQRLVATNHMEIDFPLRSKNLCN